MRTWTLVTDAVAPGGRREAFALAARGKDLVLLGESRALLEEIAAELRVVHEIDVRTLPVDLSEADAAAHVADWIEARELSIDGVVAVRWDAADGVRVAQAREQLAILEARLSVSARDASFGGVRSVSDSLPPHAIATPAPRERRSVVPPGGAPLAEQTHTEQTHTETHTEQTHTERTHTEQTHSEQTNTERPRTRTARGHRDPSVPPEI